MANVVLKLCCNSAITTNGVASVLFKVLEGGRYIDGGQAWFANPTNGDRVEVYVVDQDNILGYGEGTVVGSYTDEEVEGYQQKGWFISSSTHVSALDGYGFIPEGLYLNVVGIKGDPNLEDVFYCNLVWGNK